MKQLHTKGMVLFTAMELVIVALAFFIIINAAVNVRENITPERAQLANDVAATMTAIQSVPGMVEYHYDDARMSKYDLVVQDGIVKVIQPGASVLGERVQAVASYPAILSTPTSGILRQPPKVTISKSADGIELAAQGQVAAQQQPSPSALPDAATAQASCIGDCEPRSSS